MMTNASLAPPDGGRSRDRAERIKIIVSKTLLYVMLVLIALVMFVPFYWSLLISFRPREEIVSYPVNLLPTSFTFDHYIQFFEYGAFKYIGNTLIVIAAVLFTPPVLCSMAGYSLARLKYRFKDGIIAFFTATMMIPGIISLIPSYVVVASLGGLDSLAGIIMPATYSIYGCLFMRSFFLSTPGEIAEAARIDGAGEFRIFLQLYVPMVLPGFLTLALFTFNANWNNYLWPSLILPTTETDYGTIAVALKAFQGTYGDDYGDVMAGALISIIPSILIFVCGQKYFMENLTFAGIK